MFENVPKFGPLNGVNVVMCGLAIAGPYAASLMADYGANVMTVESSLAPDMSRSAGFFQQFHRNQIGLSLNASTPEGKEIFLKLMKTTDIFIENSKAGQWAKWGLTDEVLWAVNPKLVICHISGFGQTGDPEYVARGSWDAIGQAFSGFVSMNGNPEPDLPVSVNPLACDYYTAIYASWACLAGYINALKTGKGESIDIAQYEMMVYSMGDAVINYLTDGVMYKRAGLASPKFGGWQAYQCKDGLVLICPAGVSLMKKGLPFLGLVHGSEHFPIEWQFVPRGTKGCDILVEKLTEFCAKHTIAEAEKMLNDNGILASQIMTLDRMAENSQYKARNVFTEWPGSDGKTVKGPNTMLKFKNNPGKIWKGAPKYGMDNEMILKDLGYSDSDIAKLYEGKVISKK